MSGIYETDKLLSEYLLLHYGNHREILPWDSGPAEALDFPLRCAQICLRESSAFGRALDLGCAVGRATFELSATFEKVVGIDRSARFIAAAHTIQKKGELQYERLDEGIVTTRLIAKRPAASHPERVEFREGDACRLPKDLGQFDCVMLSNLLCRVPDPDACLRQLPGLLRSGGRVLITTPCSWMEEFTPQSAWLGGMLRDGKPVTTLEGLTRCLGSGFKLLRTEEMPFLIREHARKFQWSVAQASLWERS